MKRWLLIGGGVVATLVVVVVVVAVFVVSNLGSLIKAGVEEVGPRVTQTTVRLDDVDISARSGSGTLRGLTVGNPAGFETPSIFALGEVSSASTSARSPATPSSSARSSSPRRR